MDELTMQNMGVDPNAAIIAAGNDPRAQALKQQQARVNQLRGMAFDMAGDKGRMLGRRFVAPSPLNMVASALAAYKANQGQQGVDQGMTDVANRQNAARGQYLDRMQMALRRPYPQPSGPVLPPGDAG